MTSGPDGEPCISTGYYEEGVFPNDRLPKEPVTGLDLDYGLCPERPGAPAAPAGAVALETPAMVARRYWERVPLPKPQPVIAPGRAITGKRAYLETRGQTAHTYTNDTVFGPLEILARGTYTVDWGDGETSGPYSFEGGPWPEGRITHDYNDVGRYDVVVTERWTATWRLAGESGVLRTLQTTGRIPAFPVEQIQAVVGR